MIEPTTQTATAVAATLSGITMAMLGVDHLSVIYGFVGAMFAVFEVERLGRAKAVLLVVLSTVGGAAMGNGLVELIGPDRKAVIFLGCIACGFGVQAILSAIVSRMVRSIEGKPPAPPAAGQQGREGS
jgi:hypothetical protein